jgi:hypothetical protein
MEPRNRTFRTTPGVIEECGRVDLRSSPEEKPLHPSASSESVAHLGLVAGMFDERGLGEVIDRATPHDPAPRLVTLGNAVKAMVLNGLGVVNQPLYRGPRFFQHKPPQRLIAPGLDATHRTADTLGRALETRYAHGVTELSALIATTAAPRLGVTPSGVHLESPSLHVAGRDHRGAEPDEPVLPSTQGYSREQRPDRNPVLRALIVEHQAGIPRLLKPLRGTTRAAGDVGPVVTHPMTHRQTAPGLASLVADRAL